MLRASSTSLRAATRTSASTRLSIAKIAARSYSSGNSQESGKKSNPFTQTLVYAAPTVLAVAGFWAFVDRPHQKAKLAKKLEHAEVTESKEPEIPEETVVSEEVPETVEVTEIIIAEEVAPTLSEETKEAIDLLTADLDQALEEGAIPEDAPITSETETTTEASSTEENSEAKPEGAFNPDTGEINWDCPCLGGMANALVVKNSRLPFLASYTQKVSLRASTALKNFPVCRNASDDTLMSMLKKSETPSLSLKRTNLRELKLIP